MSVELHKQNTQGQGEEGNANTGADGNGSETGSGGGAEVGAEGEGDGDEEGGQAGGEEGEGEGEGDEGESDEGAESPELKEARAQIQTLTAERDTAIAERDAAIKAKEAAEALLKDNEGVVASALEKDLGRLTDEQKATLVAEVGDDPIKQHKQLQFMRRMGLWNDEEAPQGEVFGGLANSQEGAPDKPKNLEEIQKRVEREYRSGKNKRSKRK